MAAWCGPCRMVGPIIDEISTEYQDKAVVGKVDVDANQEFAAKYGVRNIPTVFVFKHREFVGRHVRVAPKLAYADAIDSALLFPIFLSRAIVWDFKLGVYICNR